MIVPPKELEAWAPSAMNQLYWSGICKLPWRWPEHEIAEYVSFMRSRPVYSSHVRAKSDGVARSLDDPMAGEVCSYDMADALAAPHFFPFALQFNDFARRYLGVRVPHLYSLNAFWAFPGKADANPDIQEWHRDRDDINFIALFMLGTDVDQDSHGPHLYAKGTHRTKNDGDHPPRGEPIERITGPAGTCWIEAPAGLHVGIKPRMGQRLLSWARWGVSDRPQAYLWDETQPVPQSKIGYMPNLTTEQAYSTRLIVDWNR